MSPEVSGSVLRAVGEGPRLRHRGLDQPRHQPRGRQPDRVRAVPGRRQVDHAEPLAGDGVVQRRRPAHPVVHDRREVLGAEHHRRLAGAAGQVEGVGADAGLVPPAAGHEVDRLGLAAHHPAAVGPQDPGVLVGDREHQVAVLGGAAQLVLDAADRDLQRRAVPAGGGVGLVGHRRLRDVERHGRAGPLPAAEDLRAHPRRGPDAVIHVGRPGARGVLPATVQLAPRPRHERPPAVCSATVAERIGPEQGPARAGVSGGSGRRGRTAARRGHPTAGR